MDLSREENLKVLSDRIGMLEHLSAYANNMGLQSRRSRGLFYVFERFLLNYSFAHKDKESKPFRNVEERLLCLNPKVILCTISDSSVEERLRHRAQYTGISVTKEDVLKYLEVQREFIEVARSSKLALQIINTDNMDWVKFELKILSEM